MWEVDRIEGCIEGHTAEAAANTAGCIEAVHIATSSIIAGLKLFRILI